MIKLNLRTSWVIFGLGCGAIYFCFLVNAFLCFWCPLCQELEALKAFNFGCTKNIVMYLMAFLSCEQQATLKSDEVWDPQ